MSLDEFLVEILVDPEDKEPLWYLEDEAILYNPRLRRAYPIRDGIPVLLISEAVALGDADHERLSAASYRVTGTGPGNK